MVLVPKPATGTGNYSKPLPEQQQRFSLSDLKDFNIPFSFNKYSDNIVPVAIIGDVDRQIKVVGVTTVIASTNNSTSYTCSSTKRTFLTGVVMAVTHDAASDNTNTFVSFVPLQNNSAVDMFHIVKTTLTASMGFTHIQLPIPIELKRGSVITKTNIFTVGASRFSSSFQIYEQDF